MWTVTGNLATGRAYDTATLLPGGQLLVAGGYKASELAGASFTIQPAA